jgi:hypothetical protein
VSRLWRRKSPPAGASESAERFDELRLFEHLDVVAAARAKDAFARKGIEALWEVDVAR